MRSIVWKTASEDARRSALARPKPTGLNLHDKVRIILDAVRAGGDAALRQLTREFDDAELMDLRVPDAAIARAYARVNSDELAALRRAKAQIQTFHQAQLPRDISIETSPGILCQRRAVPIERVGLYVPAGTAPLVSTVLMLGVPAEIAGCKLRVLCTPPNRDGHIDPRLLVAADLCGIRDVFTIGGAQAVAAMAYGTESIPKVDKVFGPGNSWVTEAKLQVAQDPAGAALDMPAGPSEVMVVIDQDTEPQAAAADLLSQAEHGTDSHVVLVSLCPAAAKKTQAELNRQILQLTRRDIAMQALEFSAVVEVDDMGEALEVVDRYAPEHLILLQNGARTFAQNVKNAGSIFIGPWTPESVGDYASGTNHVLPTYGYAKSFSGLGVESFMKFISYQELTVEGLLDIGPVVETLAQIEGLDGHAKAISLRIAALRKRASADRESQ